MKKSLQLDDKNIHIRSDTILFLGLIRIEKEIPVIKLYGTGIKDMLRFNQKKLRVEIS